MKRGRNVSKLLTAVLLVLLAYGAGLRIHAILAWKSGLSNDESVTYMCAAASAGSWEEEIQGLMGRAVPVGRIQEYHARPSSFRFRTVSLDMALYDVHPPLYFWILHAIHCLWGTTDGTGALLNVLIGLALLVVLFRCSRWCGLGTNASLVVCVLWYLSPAAVQIDLEARPYQLLALLAVLSYALGQRLHAGQTRPLLLAAFTMVNAAGLLTHLYFSFLLVPGALLMAWTHGVKRSSILYACSMVASGMLMLMLYPEMMVFVTGYGDRARDVPEPVDHLGRLKGVLYQTMRYFAEPRILRYTFLVLVTMAMALALARGRQALHGCRPRNSPGRLTLLLTTGWWMLFSVVLYLVGVSPAQAVGEQYFSYIWPLLSLVLVITGIRMLPGPWRHVVTGAYIAQLAVSFTWAVHGSEYLAAALPKAWNAEIANSDMLITDETKRTAIPRIARQLPAELPLLMLAGEKPDLGAARKVTYLHLDIEALRSAPVIGWLLADGFTEAGPVRKHDRYELRSFTR